MRTHRSALVLALMLSPSACQPQEVPTELRELPADAVAVGFERIEEIASSTLGGPTEPERTVIRDEATWLDFWRQLSSRTMPQPDPPTIDFDTDMVVVAAMGQRSTGGHAISIEGVFESAGILYVDVLERSPGMGCLSTQVITAPVTAVRLPKRDGSVRFMERRMSATCL